MQQKALPENECVINERIRGFCKGDLHVISRLRNLGVPKRLYWAGFRVQMLTSAVEHKTSCEEAEAQIVAWARKEWMKNEEAALLILNGASPVQEC